MQTKDYPEQIEIQQYWLVLKRRWTVVVAVFLASVGLSGFAILKQKPQYEASGMLLFKLDRISSLTKAGEKIGDLESLVREVNPLTTQAVILKSKPLLKEAINTVGIVDKKGKPLDPELLKIKVEPIVGTDVLKVSYTSEKPELSASLVNEVMQSYVKNNIQSNSSQVLAAGEFIKQQLQLSQQELERTAEAVRKFKNKNKIIELPQEASAAISNISQLDGEINQSRAMLADVSAQEAQVGNQLNLQRKQAIKITSLNQIPGVQDVLGELQKVQTKLASERTRYTDDHPFIISLKNQEKNLNLLLQQRVDQVTGSKENVSVGNLQIGKIKENLATQYLQLQVQRQGLEKKLQALSNIRGIYQQKLAIMPNLEKQQGDLERKLTVAQTNFQNLVSRQKEIQIAEKQTNGNAKIIELAEIPKKPVLSKLTLMLAGGGVFAGLLLGVSAAFFVDLIDKSLKTVKEIEIFFGYSLVGLIPKFESNSKPIYLNLMEDAIADKIIAGYTPSLMIHQAYQMLQANLKFISHKKVRTIVVTSSVTGEGKSEVCANLSGALAQAGRRVLLVDTDMHSPSQHHLWGVMNSVGLSNIIVGQDEFSQGVQVVTKYLSVLTAGVQPPNPLALIDSDRMTSLIEKFSQSYDYIVFDTPPLVNTVDAAVLGKMVDGVLLVAQPGVLDLASATAAKSLLDRSEVHVLGIIANGVNIKQERDGYFYHSKRRVGQSVAKTEMEIEQFMYK
ncbi:polysaccharide biosynthesis tyrosine autokinase [Plectonema radiosum NIES-515]|uniref:Polysaccharide biosynthesis tyrosine autokinase n=1 Tax=Plectonema radiosum NIES-515 TaxID=2986073 RepID=A0ABT3B6B9_9CYAN|nr:polysaccharide biosynthesis tyrosine autokinase [Plectonema radiosum]MCV3216495.1 polysaccharide biosynthesis tyrosine autokinase [Plectonema radiosum NIES-515]